MKPVFNLISLLHESAINHSASRQFHGRPVLRWTLDRLKQCKTPIRNVVLCWDDQAEPLRQVSGNHAVIHACGVRHAVASLDSVSASRRWADGWRSGPYGTCAFDAGFDAASILQALDDDSAEAVLLVDPAAAMIDPALIDQLCHHARNAPSAEIVFAQAAPGLCGVILRPALIRRLAQAKLHPGRLLHYMPQQPAPDPIAGIGCLPVAMPVARSTGRFLIDSERQASRLEHLISRGELMDVDALQLVERSASGAIGDLLPREIVLELTTQRHSKPIFSPLASRPVERTALSLTQAQKLFDETGRCDDIRLTLGGIGDPLLHPQAVEMIQLAHDAGLAAIHLETDLLGLSPEVIATIASLPIDIISLHLPAMTRQTYAAVMGIDGFENVIANLRLLATARQQRKAGVPLIVPTFTKCQINLGEMELWYDHWLNTFGSAVIVGPRDFNRQIDYVGVCDMNEQHRAAQQRLKQLMILSDGRVVASEDDFEGRQNLGNVSSQSIAQIWHRHTQDCRQRPQRPGDPDPQISVKQAA